MNITTWTFNGATVRTVILPNGEPGFVGKDVAARLGYTNPSKAMGDHCKGVTIGYPLQTAGGTQNVRILTEPDVLRLIISSKLPAAQEFERWVFEEVLPSIRKTGSYVAQPAASLNLTHSYTDAVAGAEVVARMLAILRSACAERPGTKPDTRMVANVYAALQKAGILEQRTRASTSNPAGVKQFWSITEKGLEFGKNITSEKNQRETAPHWYTDTAGKLLDIAIDAARII